MIFFKGPSINDVSLEGEGGGPPSKPIYYISVFNNLSRQGEGGGHKFGKMGRLRLWMAPNVFHLLMHAQLQWNTNLFHFHSIFNSVSFGTKVHSFLKQCCARSSFHENKVLHLMPAEEGFVEIPCFHKMKIVQTLL